MGVVKSNTKILKFYNNISGVLITGKVLLVKTYSQLSGGSCKEQHYNTVSSITIYLEY